MTTATDTTDRDEHGFLTPEAAAKLSDDQALALAGPCGPAIIGHALHDRAASVRKNRVIGTGVEQLIVGPAIAEHDYHLRGKPTPAAPVTPSAPTVTEPDGPVDPWSHVSKSGLKKLAKAAKVAVDSKATRDEIVDALVAAGVEPPPVPEE